jgi:hypothetical protein
MEENKELQEIEINLNAVAEGKIDESFLRTFGWAIQKIMGTMFGGSSIPVQVKGNQTQVRDFARVLGREKKYLDSYRKFGLDNPQTYKSKFSLDSAVKKFQRSTGLKWPFK